MPPEVKPYKTALDPGNAYWMARISSEIYKTPESGGDEPDEKKILESLRGCDSKFMSVTGADKNSAQAALIEHKDYICMVFRGTDQIADWLDNLRVYRVSALFGEFHVGFWESVEDVWDVLSGKLKYIRSKRKKPLFITGHSLGGAMATIAAARLIHEDRTFTSVYTFGQPRAMDRDTGRIYEIEIKGRHYRFQNNEDVVTRIPTRVTGFTHVGNCLYIDNDGKIQNDPGFWYRFLDTVEGAMESVMKSGRTGLIKDHDIENYKECVEKWNCDF